MTNEDDFHDEYLLLSRTNKRPELPLKGSKQQLILKIPLPLKKDLDFLLLYTKTPYFDTGDLWKTAKDLKNYLESNN
ncbi:MAG: hypothetical protein ACFFB5_06020 [Promethearchaeota archaeon]